MDFIGLVKSKITENKEKRGGKQKNGCSGEHPSFVLMKIIKVSTNMKKLILLYPKGSHGDARCRGAGHKEDAILSF